MKKLALAFGLGAYVVFSSSASSLAAQKADTASTVSAAINSRIAWAESGTNPQLLFVNEALYPDTTVWDTDTTFCTDGNCISR